MVAGDVQIAEGRAAPITLQCLRREEEDGDVQRQDDEHGDEHRPSGREAEYAAEAKRQREYCDKSGDLRKPAVSVERVASAGEASPQVSFVILGSLPVEENHAAEIGFHLGRCFSGDQFDGAELLVVEVA